MMEKIKYKYGHYTNYSIVGDSPGVYVVIDSMNTRIAVKDNKDFYITDKKLFPEDLMVESEEEELYNQFMSKDKSTHALAINKIRLMILKKHIEKHDK